MKLTIVASIFILSLFFIPSVAYGAEWFNDDWEFAQKITINSTEVNGTLANFILGVNLTSTSLLNGAASNGLDILFTTIDNETKLNHEVEQYDNSIGWLTAWVTVPLVTDAFDTQIMMYYGDMANNGQQNNTLAVWENYDLVMHLGDDLCDSSGNNLCDATNFGTTVINNIGKARSFDGINDFIQINGDYLDNIFEFGIPNKNFTIQSWIQRNSGNAGTDTIYIKGRFLSGGTFENQTSLFEARSGQDDRWCWIQGQNGFITTCSTTTPTSLTLDELDLRATAWKDDDGIHNRHDYSEIRNGTCISTSGGSNSFNDCQFTSQVRQFTNSTKNLRVGANNAGTQAWTGIFDELRIANFKISRDQITTEFNNLQNQHKNQFLIFGSEGQNPNLDFDTIFLRIADQFRNHIGYVTNTDTTTDLSHNTEPTPTTVPITGTIIFMDSSFFVSGDGIACNYDGRVKITASLHVESSTSSQRAAMIMQFVIDGVVQDPVSATGYLRYASNHDNASYHLTHVANCSLGDVITIQTYEESVNAEIEMASVGSSMLLVERI